LVLREPNGSPNYEEELERVDSQRTDFANLGGG
jgi:hypothetical protein